MTDKHDAYTRPVTETTKETPELQVIRETLTRRRDGYTAFQPAEPVAEYLHDIRLRLSLIATVLVFALVAACISTIYAAASYNKAAKAAKQLAYDTCVADADEYTVTKCEEIKPDTDDDALD
jgi:hypothetical protein